MIEFRPGRGCLLVRGAYARDEEPGPTERVTPGYRVIDLGGGWQISRQPELRVFFRNVTDITYSRVQRRRLHPRAGALGGAHVRDELLNPIQLVPLPAGRTVSR